MNLVPVRLFLIFFFFLFGVIIFTDQKRVWFFKGCLWAFNINRSGWSMNECSRHNQWWSRLGNLRRRLYFLFNSAVFFANFRGEFFDSLFVNFRGFFKTSFIFYELRSGFKLVLNSRIWVVAGSVWTSEFYRGVTH